MAGSQGRVPLTPPIRKAASKPQARRLGLAAKSTCEYSCLESLRRPRLALLGQGDGLPPNVVTRYRGDSPTTLHPRSTPIAMAGPIAAALELEPPTSAAHVASICWRPRAAADENQPQSPGEPSQPSEASKGVCAVPWSCQRGAMAASRRRVFAWRKAAGGQRSLLSSLAQRRAPRALVSESCSASQVPRRCSRCGHRTRLAPAARARWRCASQPCGARSGQPARLRPPRASSRPRASGPFRRATNLPCPCRIADLPHPPVSS